MKLLTASVKYLAIVLVFLTAVSFFAMEQININNTWLNIKPVSNAANITNLVEREKNRNLDIQDDDELTIANVKGLLPNLTEEEKLYDKTFYYVEGTYGAYCVVTFNDTDNPEKENMIIKTSDNYAMKIENHGGNCSEGIVERAYENAWYVGPEGGIPVV